MLSVRASNLGKRYRIYARPTDGLKELLFGRRLHEEFWALRGVDFEIVSGGTLGVIGANGSGKTTLLRLLAETTRPSEGNMEVVGRVGAILELGTGFHPELSGRENAAIACAVLGMSPAETQERLDAVVEFSELGDFFERPVKTYSSGMYVRLAFSVLSSVEPDVLVVDEALAVGDQHFRKKCTDRMLDFRRRNRTLVLASHDMYLVKHLCDRAIWLKNGRVEMFGPTSLVVEQYEDFQRTLDQEPDEASRGDATRGPFRVESVSLGGALRDGIVQTGSRLTVDVVACFPEGTGHVGVMVRRNDGVICYGTSTEIDGQGVVPLGAGRFGARLMFDRLPLLAGEYIVDVAILDETATLTYEFVQGTCEFRVEHSSKEVGLFRPEHRWDDKMLSLD